MAGQTQNSIFAIFVIAVVIYGLLYWLRFIRLSRGTLRHSIKTIVLGLASGAAVYGICGYSVILMPNALPLAMAAAAIIFVTRSSVTRSRYIPAAVRRAVIARDLKGEQFDSSKHHIDHIVPFSRGGGHTIDNLRVVLKKDNLKKGGRRPRFREMW